MRRITAMVMAGVLAGAMGVTAQAKGDLINYAFEGGQVVIGTDYATDQPCEDLYYGVTQDWDGHDGWCDFSDATVAAAKRGDPRFSPVVRQILLGATRRANGMFGSPVSILD